MKTNNVSGVLHGGIALVLLLFTAFSSDAVGVAAGQACPLVGETRLDAVFPGAAAPSVQAMEKPYPTCRFTWPARTKEVRMIGGQRIELPRENRVTVTRAPASGEADWAHVLRSYGDEVLLELDGIGETAVWSAKRKQLSARTPEAIWHIAVEYFDGDDGSRVYAERLARELLD
jgi:hypothetical protein